MATVLISCFLLRPYFYYYEVKVVTGRQVNLSDGDRTVSVCSCELSLMIPFLVVPNYILFKRGGFFFCS